MTIEPKEQKRMAEILSNAHEMAQRKFDEPAERLMHELLHAAIALAGEHGRGRRLVAFGLGLAPSTLDTRLGSSEDCLTQSHIARMLFDPAVLGPIPHGWLIGRIALLGGRKILMPAGDEAVGDDELAGQALDVMDSVGLLASQIRIAIEIRSAGGRAVTGTERRKISAAAGMVGREALQLVDGGVN